MLAAAFVGQGIDALRSPKQATEAAVPTAEGLQHLPESVRSNVPENAETIAKITAAAQIGGGLLLASGRVPRLASAALAATVIPANLGSHMFWNEIDPERKAAKRRALLTDISLIGGLAIAAADTAGKPSLGWRGRRAAHKLSESVSSALPIGSAAESDLVDRVGHRLSEGLSSGAEHGRELAVRAGQRSAPLLDAAREHGTEWVERSGPLLEDARHRAAELVDRSAPLLEDARDRAAELAKAAVDQSEEAAEQARKRVQTWRGH